MIARILGFAAGWFSERLRPGLPRREEIKWRLRKLGLGVK